MNIEPNYFAVFFIEGDPANFLHSEYKRILQNEFNNLTDGMEGKTVILKRNDEVKPSEYLVTLAESFGIDNTVDNHLFVVCHVRKLK